MNPKASEVKRVPSWVNPDCEHRWTTNLMPEHSFCMLCGLDEHPHLAAARLREERNTYSDTATRQRNLLRQCLDAFHDYLFGHTPAGDNKAARLIDEIDAELTDYKRHILTTPHFDEDNGHA